MKAQAYFDKPMVVRVFPTGDCRSIADLPLRACTPEAADQALRQMRLRRCSRWEQTQWGRDANVCFASSNSVNHMTSETENNKERNKHE